MESRGGRTKIPAPAGGERPAEEAAPDLDDGPTYVADMEWDYGANAASGQEGRRRAFFGRRDELRVIERMLVRHRGFTPERARAVVWTQPGLVQGMFRQRGRPPKPHLIHAADVADAILSRGEEVRWDVLHRSVVAWNDPGESRPVEYAGERSREPRDSENWQRAVRRIRNRLRAEAARLAEGAR
jgi:hypothetical protein